MKLLLTTRTTGFAQPRVAVSPDSPWLLPVVSSIFWPSFILSVKSSSNSISAPSADAVPVTNASMDRSMPPVTSGPFSASGSYTPLILSARTIISVSSLKLISSTMSISPASMN